MKAVIQRVKSASLSVKEQTVSEIGKGIVVFLGIECGDTKEQAQYISKKIVNMRIFDDERGKMNYSVADVGGGILLVSQFTLCADMTEGNRPSFIFAEEPKRANELFEFTFSQLKSIHSNTVKGVFGADMQISQHNDGPVTIILQN